ncbi:MAG: type II toxin-antitoxin system RelE/ParE family toxin [Candidatus Diapherotrites archaeon]|nr:type II toxin-antitoxin system RelE/ParE family toxin [Candidatus Diapherotrites archaeon]
MTSAKESGLDIKKLKGNWSGFYRLRVGKYRVVFEIDWSKQEILIYRIVARKKAYR